MGYRIEYDNLGGKYEISREKSGRFPFLLAVGCGLCLLGVCACWPEGAEKLQNWLIPGDDAVTTQAFHILRENLKNGAPVGKAVEAFCRFVIHGA